MTRSSVMLKILLAFVLPGCAAQVAARTPFSFPAAPPPAEIVTAPAEPPPDDAPPSGPVYAAGEDRHWMQADDYFISDQPWTQGWIYVHLAKLRQPSGPATKGQALFFRLDNSRDEWTEHFWQTRVPGPGPLALGTMVLCFNDNQRDSTYLAPPSKDRARTGAWFLGRITDTSDAFKHRVRVDVYNCDLHAIRVLVGH